MPSLTRQLNDAEKAQVLAAQKRDGVLRCFADDHPIADETEVEFHHIRPYSEDGPTEVSNIGAVCKDHHRRIRTLSLSEFRDQLALERFFDHPEPRRLDDLLAVKLSDGNFGRPVNIDKTDGQVKLHFLDRPPLTSAIFECPSTGMRYFYGVVPLDYIRNDADLQPRPLEQKRVWELYRHLSSHTQLAPAVCRLVDRQILLFDGQHKSAAQIWAGRKALDCKVYIEPDVRRLKDTNLMAHDKLRQMAFFTSTLVAKYADIFKQEWEDYLERPGIKTEGGFVLFLKARGKTLAEARKMLMMAIEQDVLDDPDNHIVDFIAERNRSRKNPLTIALLQKTFFKDFVVPPPLEIEFESSEDFRVEERRNLVRLLSLVADKQLCGQWNPDADNAAHRRADRIFSAGAVRAWVPMLKDVLAQVLQLYDAADREKVVFRKISEDQWHKIEGRIDRLFTHKIWDDPDPDVASQLKVNAVEQVREFMGRKGLTVNWILGIEAN